MKEIAIFGRDLLFLYFLSLPTWAASLQTLTAIAIHPAIAVLTVFLCILLGYDASWIAPMWLILFMGMWTCLFTYQFTTWCYWIGKV